MTKAGLVEEIHRSARRNFQRRRVIIKGLFDLWQADLVEMIPYARVNQGYRYLLTVIDTCSKRAWAEPTKTKSGKDVTDAMRKVLRESGTSPRLLQVDNGKEFYNKDFEALMKDSNIKLYSVYTTMKASIVERFNRTLKTKMWKRFSLRGTYQWTDILKELLHEYNNTVHSSIGMKPVDVKASHVPAILRRLAAKDKEKSRVRKFRVGDAVRISKEKSIFEKGYTPNWSAEVFKVIKVQRTRPVTYLLKDSKGLPIEGGFYREELQKTRFEDEYLVEKVLRTKGDQLYVKWYGFDSTHNSWIHKSALV